MNELTEKATRIALDKLFDPPLTESQVESVIRRMGKLVDEGHAEDYSFVTAISRYKPRDKHASP